MSSGKCLCGAIEYTFRGEITDACYCHCSICRKLTGSAFAAWGTVSSTGFSWVKGENLLSVFQPSPATWRKFCPGCGSLLATEHKDEPDCVFIALGSLDNNCEIEIRYHQFTGSKAGWYAIDDTIAKFSEWPEKD